jgi:hypothetical protein
MHPSTYYHHVGNLGCCHSWYRKPVGWMVDPASAFDGGKEFMNTLAWGAIRTGVICGMIGSFMLGFAWGQAPLLGQGTAWEILFTVLLGIANLLVGWLNLRDVRTLIGDNKSEPHS